ncbi:hypothetical protein PAPYR_33 [Paratrimastix pyriformis]|uniref:Transcription factor TFIIB cyclin-like domain-containing protein n=1 Tax=Paratrimastix pyriformis TaxID=342808 RepID=A0ABQ8UYI7_9EUKA|nr:hypothetical protein PAPYR_33 [Paratrimastix pyriformis]
MLAPCGHVFNPENVVLVSDEHDVYTMGMFEYDLSSGAGSARNTTIRVAQSKTSARILDVRTDMFLVKARQKITNLGASLALSRAHIEEARLLMEQALCTWANHSGRFVELTAAAALYATIRTHQVGITLFEVAERMAGVSVLALARCFAQLVLRAGLRLRPTDPSFFVERLIARFGLTAHRAGLESMLEICNPLVAGRPPHATAAAIVFWYCDAIGQTPPISMSDLATCLNTTETTVRKRLLEVERTLHAFLASHERGSFERPPPAMAEFRARRSYYVQLLPIYTTADRYERTVPTPAPPAAPAPALPAVPVPTCPSSAPPPAARPILPPPPPPAALQALSTNPLLRLRTPALLRSPLAGPAAPPGGGGGGEAGSPSSSPSPPAPAAATTPALPQWLLSDQVPPPSLPDSSGEAVATTPGFTFQDLYPTLTGAPTPGPVAATPPLPSPSPSPSPPPAAAVGLLRSPSSQAPIPAVPPGLVVPPHLFVPGLAATASTTRPVCCRTSPHNQHRSPPSSGSSQASTTTPRGGPMVDPPTPLMLPSAATVWPPASAPAASCLHHPRLQATGAIGSPSPVPLRGLLLSPPPPSPSPAPLPTGGPPAAFNLPPAAAGRPGAGGAATGGGRWVLDLHNGDVVFAGFGRPNPSLFPPGTPAPLLAVKREPSLPEPTAPPAGAGAEAEAEAEARASAGPSPANKRRPTKTQARRRQRPRAGRSLSPPAPPAPQQQQQQQQQGTGPTSSLRPKQEPEQPMAMMAHAVTPFSSPRPKQEPEQPMAMATPFSQLAPVPVVPVPTGVDPTHGTVDPPHVDDALSPVTPTHPGHPEPHIAPGRPRPPDMDSLYDRPAGSHQQSAARAALPGHPLPPAACVPVPAADIPPGASDLARLMATRRLVAETKARLGPRLPPGVAGGTSTSTPGWGGSADATGADQPAEEQFAGLWAHHRKRWPLRDVGMVEEALLAGIPEWLIVDMGPKPLSDYRTHLGLLTSIPPPPTPTPTPAPHPPEPVSAAAHSTQPASAAPPQPQPQPTSQPQQPPTASAPPASGEATQPPPPQPVEEPLLEDDLGPDELANYIRTEDELGAFVALAGPDWADRRAGGGRVACPPGAIHLIESARPGGCRLARHHASEWTAEIPDRQAPTMMMSMASSQPPVMSTGRTVSPPPHQREVGQGLESDDGDDPELAMAAATGGELRDWQRMRPVSRTSSSVPPEEGDLYGTPPPQARHLTTDQETAGSSPA